MKNIAKIRFWVFLLLLVITPLGFACKMYSGPWHLWLNNYAAGLLYEVFWILVVFFFIPKREIITKIVLWVFLATSFLEILQLWHPWFLEQVRSTFLGRSLIGTSFVWWDFPHYALGCLLGWLLLQRLVRLSMITSKASPKTKKK